MPERPIRLAYLVFQVLGSVLATIEPDLQVGRFTLPASAISTFSASCAEIRAELVSIVTTQMSIATS